MIGIIDNYLIFEFKDEGDLNKALAHFAKSNNVNTLIISSKMDTIKAVLYNDKFLFMPYITTDEEYILYGAYYSSEPMLSKNDDVPSHIDWTVMSRFKYRVMTVPTLISE